MHQMHGSVLPKFATGDPRWQLFRIAKSKYSLGQECTCEHAFIWSPVRLWRQSFIMKENPHVLFSKHLQTKPPSKNPAGAESTLSRSHAQSVLHTLKKQFIGSTRELPNKMTTTSDWWSRASSEVVVFNCIANSTLSPMALCLHSFSKCTARSPAAAISCCPQSPRGI